MIGWVDGTAGASGDMLLGALVDAGVALDAVQSAIDLLDLGVELRPEQVSRAGLAATRVHVDVPETTTVRHLADIIDMLAVLPTEVRDHSVAVFQLLARAEADVHGTTLDQVHFHEVGALDSIADIVGVCAGFHALGLDALHCSTLSLGSGTTRGAHGPIPVPAPAVLALTQGVALTAGGPAPYESTTPTGAALLVHWVTQWGPMPSMIPQATGMGAGTKDTDAVANVCRLVLGHVDAISQEPSMVQLDANVDDLDPRVWPEAIAAVMSAGAVDAWVTPIVMKKGRPAHTFSALCAADDADSVSEAVFVQTSTIGIRQHDVTRSVLARTESTVDFQGCTIRVKTAHRNGAVVNRSAEWDDVVAAAASLDQSPNDVLSAVNRLL
ncbi:MAG: nickel pincer cofactor biosynthesis protein LarC [Ilumatobacter sp.]